ncbi:MAG: LysM peptidoglycan-binding domain-containing protein [Caldilineaceae bacterium]|nr:LysM peptidoglycan-binding domain-containing protein [Caldilineaceae bacterium]
MNRRQLAFVIVMNALISLVVAVGVVWVVELRRPDPEVLAAIYTPVAAAQIAPTFTPTQAAPAAVPAETPTPEPPLADAGNEEFYVVQAGDSLSAIADRYGVSVQAIMEANDLSNPDFVFSGQWLRIPDTNSAPAPALSPTPAPTPGANTGIRVAVVDSSGNLAFERVQIVNDSDLAVNLQGWRLEREGGATYTFGSVPLFPGGGIILYSGAGTDTSVTLYWNRTEAVWQSGAVARLVNAQGDEVSRLTVP